MRWEHSRYSERQGAHYKLAFTIHCSALPIITYNPPAEERGQLSKNPFHVEPGREQEETGPCCSSTLCLSRLFLSGSHLLNIKGSVIPEIWLLILMAYSGHLKAPSTTKNKKQIERRLSLSSQDTQGCSQLL